MQEWAERFPDLIGASVSLYQLTLRFLLQPPADPLVSNVRIIGRSEGGIVVCRNDLGWRFLPGGTREPGESIPETAERELLEEAGAHITGPLEWLGAFEVTNPDPEPYRPHLPHPVSYWLYVLADITITRAPTNPTDGENVTEVHLLPPDDAATYLDDFDSPMAAVLRLAIAMARV